MTNYSTGTTMSYLIETTTKTSYLTEKMKNYSIAMTTNYLTEKMTSCEIKTTTSCSS
jgi:hypothetical protein